MKLDGEKVFRLRESAGLTRSQLAKRAGLHRDTVLQIEMDRRECMMQTATKIAKALGCSVDEIRDREVKWY